MRSRFSVIFDDNRGFVHYSYLLLIFGIIILLTVMLLENHIAVLVRDRLDNSLTDAVLSGIVYDYEGMYKEFCSFDILSDGIQVRCRIQSQDTASGISSRLLENYNSSTDLTGVLSNFRVSRIIVYNVGENLEITTYTDGIFFDEYVENYNKADIKTPNNVPVRTTCVYAEITFDMRGLTGNRQNLVISKCVEISNV